MKDDENCTGGFDCPVHFAQPLKPAPAPEPSGEPVLNDGYPAVMTDEQITEALWKCPGGYSPEGVAVQRQIAALRAEVERLRANEILNRKGYDALNAAEARADAAEAERDALRRIVEEEGPHGSNCAVFQPRFIGGKWDTSACDCWKAKAKQGPR